MDYTPGQVLEYQTMRSTLLKRIRESLAERELSLNLSDEASALLVEKGWDPAMGARPLRRAIQRYIEDERKRETFGVGAKGDAREEGLSTDPSSESDPAGELPDEPEVLPDVPDAPPAPESKDD
jgi:C-terminal, D2-small domain, of ClpB protein